MPRDDHPHSEQGRTGKASLNYRALADQLLIDGSYISLAELTRAIGCSYWTVYGWKKNDPEFAAAFKVSQQKAVDGVWEHAFTRAMGQDWQKSSDLLTMYILNNRDEEVVERLRKNANPEITIRLEVPSLSASPISWAQEVKAALPDAAIEASYREILQVPKEAE